MKCRSYAVGSNRRKREEDLVEIRKKKRHEKLFKKRWEGNKLDTPYHMDPLLEDIPILAHYVLSDDAAEQLKGTSQIGKLLSRWLDPPFEEVVRTGVVPKFVEFLSRDDTPQLQMQATRNLTSIIWAMSEQTRVVIEFGAIPKLVRLIRSPTSSDDLKKHAARTLTNISGSSLSERDIVLDHGAILPLLSLLSISNRQPLLFLASCILYNLCCKPLPTPIEKILPVLPILRNLIVIPDEKIVSNVCWTLSCLSDDDDEMVKAIVEADFVPRLVALLMHHSSNALEPALRTLGNIAKTDHTQIVVDYHILPCLHLLLTLNTDRIIVKEVCWIISNITAGTKSQIQAVLDANLFKHLLYLTKAEFSIKVEATCAIYNAVMQASKEQILFMAKEGCIEVLWDLTLFPDPNIMSICLEGVENILNTAEKIDEKEN